MTQDEGFWNWKDKLGELTFLGGNLDLSDTAGRVRFIIIVVISIFFAVFIGVNAYASYLWITAFDNEEQLQKAKKIIKDSFIGLFMALGFLVVLGILAFFLGIDLTVSLPIFG